MCIPARPLAWSESKFFDLVDACKTLVRSLTLVVAAARSTPDAVRLLPLIALKFGSPFSLAPAEMMYSRLDSFRGWCAHRVATHRFKTCTTDGVMCLKSEHARLLRSVQFLLLFTCRQFSSDPLRSVQFRDPLHRVVRGS